MLYRRRDVQFDSSFAFLPFSVGVVDTWYSEIKRILSDPVAITEFLQTIQCHLCFVRTKTKQQNVGPILDLWFAVVLSLKLNKSFVLTFCGLILALTDDRAHHLRIVFVPCLRWHFQSTWSHTNRKPTHAILDEQRVKRMRQYESQQWKNLFALNEIVSFDFVFFVFCLPLR